MLENFSFYAGGIVAPVAWVSSMLSALVSSLLVVLSHVLLLLTLLLLLMCLILSAVAAFTCLFVGVDVMCIIAASKQTAADVEEGIVQFLEEDSWLAGRFLSMPSWGHNISELPQEEVHSSPSRRGDFIIRSSSSWQMLLFLNI